MSKKSAVKVQPARTPARAKTLKPSDRVKQRLSQEEREAIERRNKRLAYNRAYYRRKKAETEARATKPAVTKAPSKTTAPSQLAMDFTRTDLIGALKAHRSAAAAAGDAARVDALDVALRLAALLADA